MTIFKDIDYYRICRYNKILQVLLLSKKIMLHTNWVLHTISAIWYFISQLTVDHISGLEEYNVFITGQAKLDPKYYAIKCMDGRQLYEY